MIQITFDSTSRDSVLLYELLYEGWVIGSHIDQRGPLGDKRWSWDYLLKVEGGITRQFHSVGCPTSCGRKLVTDDIALTLQGAKNLKMELTKEQYDLLDRRFRIVPWNVGRIPTIEQIYNTFKMFEVGDKASEH